MLRAVSGGWTKHGRGTAASSGGGSTPANAPTFGTAAGTYDRAMTQSITLSTSSVGASIYYTVDGSTPTTGSTLYTAAIPVDATTTIKALASGGGFSDSSVSSATYTIIAPQLYITANGFNAGTSFVDSSGYGKTITTVANAQTSTAQSVYGGSSGLCDGSVDCVWAAADASFGFGTGDFIITHRFRLNSISVDQTILSCLNTAADTAPHVYFASTNATIRFFTNSADRITSEAISINTWYDLKIIRLSGVTKMYLNGVQTGSNYTDSNNYGTSKKFVVGDYGSTLSGASTFNGYFTQTATFKGSGLTDTEVLAWYNANVPFAPHPNLLLHMDGTNGSTTFTDSSNLAATVTDNGSATITTTSPKFGTGSGSFDGSNYLSLGGQSAYAFGSADFTIEGWFNPTGSGGAADSLVGFGPTGVDGVYPSIIRVSGNLCYYTNVGTRITGGALTTNTWQHIALVRKAGTTNLYLGGVAQGTQYTDTNVYLNGTSRPLINGYGLTPGTVGMIGKTDELQIINGYAKYTGNFTPPTAPFVA